MDKKKVKFMTSLAEVRAYLYKHAPFYDIPTDIVLQKVMGLQRSDYYKNEGRGDSYGRIINPFDSLDDAKLVLDKLDRDQAQYWSQHLGLQLGCVSALRDRECVIVDEGIKGWKYANATALDRMVALFTCMPELMEINFNVKIKDCYVQDSNQVRHISGSYPPTEDK